MQTNFKAIFFLAVLAGCGGGGGGTAAPPVKTSDGNPGQGSGTVDTSGTRGFLRAGMNKVASYDPATLKAQIDKFGFIGASINDAVASLPCGVDVHHFEYNTVGAAGEATTSSAALMIPTGSGAACSGKRPLMMYGHGSSNVQNVNMSDFSTKAPYGATSITVAAMYAAQGYLVIAPNYAGYDTSTLSYHPHHIGDQNGKEMIDALSAGRSALAAVSVSDNGKLFLTGYSEGGYVTMATARAMQAAGIAVTAAAPQSGNYAESVGYENVLTNPHALDDLSQIDQESIMHYAMQIPVWQKAYGNLYSAITDVYSATYAAGIEGMFPTKGSTDALFLTNKLPRYMLANDMPNYASLTADQKLYYGTPETSLLKTSYVVKLVADAGAHPCNVTSAVAPLDCAATAPMRLAALKNDLRTWTPKSPMLMCGGNGDNEVGFYNAQLTMAYFAAHGLAANTVSVLDVDSPVAAGDPYAAAKTAFAKARQRVVAANDNPNSNDNYHGYTAFIGCSVAVRDFFKNY